MRLPDGWLFTPRHDEKDRTKIVVEMTEMVRCRNCKHRFDEVYGAGNVVVNACDLDHNQVMSDDWFCADGERSNGDD